jgi:Predicted pPIWI-associating nuclease
MSAIASVLARVEDARRTIRHARGKQIFSAPACAKLHSLAESYFSTVAPGLSNAADPSVTNAEKVFRTIHQLSRKHPSKAKCLGVLTEAKSLLVRLEGIAIAQAAAKSSGVATAADKLIVSTLDDICPSAGLAYRQALVDLSDADRHSWRGPATDLREALRETLDILAPDNEVESTGGYKPEADAKRPTMRQKVRYILKSRGAGSGQIATPESALQGIEDMLGGLTRSVYSRSSVSTHTPTTKAEVLRVHTWVRLVLCELLALPL